MNRPTCPTGVPTTAEEAEQMGWTADRHCYPWRAYIGPCFAPTECVMIATPAAPARRARINASEPTP